MDVEKFTTSKVKEPEWQVGISYYHPDDFGEIYRTQRNYQYLLEDAVEILSGEWTAIPKSSNQEIYVAVQVTYNKGKRYVKDIKSLLENDVKQQKKGESDE